MQLHGFRCGLLFLFFSFASALFGQTKSKDILFIRHGQSTYNQMMEQKHKLQKLKKIAFSRKKIKDANLTQNGIVEALKLRSCLLESLGSEDVNLKFIAKALLEPRADVMVLSSNLRRAVNTGLLVLYGDDRDKEIPLKRKQPIYPIYVSSLLQEWGVPQAVPDVMPHSKNFFKHGQLISSAVQSSLGSFTGNLEKYLKIFPKDREISTEGQLRRGKGNTKRLKDKYNGFLQNIVFADSQEVNLDLSKKQVIVVFGHGRWLKGFVNFFSDSGEAKMGIAPNASLTHMKLEKHDNGKYRLSYLESYTAL
ncbi:MAG: hypothetical protein AB8G05_16290 [Oligoflexales bacterium]